MKQSLVIYHMLEKNQFNTGSVHQMFQAATGLRERGHHVTVVSRPEPTLAARCAENDIRFEPLPLRSEFDLGSIRALKKLVERDQPDVIHVHKGLVHTIGLAATWRNRVGAFVVNRGVSFPLTVWNRPKFRTSRVDRIVTVCQQNKDEVVRSGKVPDAKVEVVYAGTDVTLFDPARWSREDFRHEKAIPTNAFVFAQVGVRDWKGWKELIDAFAMRAVEHRDWYVALIAYKSEEQKREVEAYAESRGVRDRVLAIEYRADMARVLASSDCVVDASWAGTGITGTIREGMALRKPVIATDCGGNNELITPDVGWLIPMKNDKALADAMEEVYTNPALASQRAAAAMARVRSGFSMTRRIDHLEEVYREILASKEKQA